MLTALWQVTRKDTDTAMYETTFKCSSHLKPSEVCIIALISFPPFRLSLISGTHQGVLSGRGTTISMTLTASYLISLLQ